MPFIGAGGTGFVSSGGGVLGGSGKGALWPTRTEELFSIRSEAALVFNTSSKTVSTLVVPPFSFSVNLFTTQN